MSMFTARINGFLLLALVVLLGWYLLGIRESTNTDENEGMQHSVIEDNLNAKHPEPATNPNSVEKKVVQPIATAQQTYADIEVPVESEELIEWRLERGYPDENNSYNGYDEVTLNTLADSGDIRAMHKLAEHYASRDNLSDADKAVISDIYREAAVYGSTFALLYLGVQQESAYANLSADDPKRHETAIEILSTYNLAALRGDKMPNISRASYFLSQNNIQLSDEDKQTIQSRSQEIYNNLARHRYALSLDEFDNSVPESVSQYFSEVEAVQEKVKQRQSEK